MKNIGVILASTREGRIGEQIAKHALELVNNSDKIKYSLIDLREVNLPFLDEPYPAAMNKYQHEHTKKWSKVISGYDAFIIVTAEYNHGYPGVLKNALDYLYVEWQNKPMGIISYGYTGNGARSAEQLRSVISYLQAKVFWNDVNISLGATIKDNKFKADEVIDKKIKDLFKGVEDLLG